MGVSPTHEIAEPVALPTDDDRLTAALADLDSKLTAWSGAIAHAQSSLIDLLENQKAKPAPAPAPKIHPIAETEFHPAPAPAAPACTVEAPAEPPAVAQAATPPAALEGSQDDDAALLATLDPEAQKKVQLLRRLSGNTKSIRELVEKHNLTAGTPAPSQPAKKSFWRR